MSSKKAKYNAIRKDPKESPWDKSSLLAKYFLYFMIPMIRKGFRGKLNLEDVWSPPKVDYSRTLGMKLEQNYNKELMRIEGKASFVRALWKTFGSQLILICFADFCSKCIAFPMQTIALGWIIRDTSAYLVASGITPNVSEPVVAAGANQAVGIVDNEQDAYWKIVYDAGLLVAMTILATGLSHPFFLQSYHIGMKVRVASCYMIYKKSLRLSQSALSETTVGQMVNLLSNDVNRFDQVVQLLPYTILAPIQAAIVLSILAGAYIGIYPTLASLITIVIYMAVQTTMGKGFSKFRGKTAKRTDERVRLMNEIILAMRIIKMYAWEKPFQKLVTAARNREMNTIAVGAALKVVNQTLFFVSSKIIVSVILITYVLVGNNLTAEIVFVTIGLSNMIRISLTLFFPNAVAYTAETLVSCKRINNFLQLPEINTLNSSLAIYKLSNDSFGCKYTMALKNCWCSWSTPDQISKLNIPKLLEEKKDPSWAIVRDLSLSLSPKDLLLIVGRVGSGKSSVLMAMLGELPLVSGELEVNGRISYASQEAWIFSGTVKENILLGKPYLPERYTEVVRVCSLERDLEILVEGDETIVGERGVSLSGGQKARVNLARALYADADIYLLDDPLSAVDAPVAKHIFNESLRTFLRKKTVVLATHQLQFLRYATKVLVMDREQAAAFGTLQEVLDSDAFKLVNYSKAAFEDATTSDPDPEFKRAKSVGSQGSSNLSESLRSLAMSADPTGKLTESLHELLVPSGTTDKKELNEKEEENTVAAEEKPIADRLLAAGDEKLKPVSVDMSTYTFYLRNAAGIFMIIFFILINIIAQTFFQLTDFFLSFWAESVEQKQIQGINYVPKTFIDQLDTLHIILVYAGLVAICIVASFLRSVTFFTACYNASVNLHKRLFDSVLYAPMTFFDFSPIGILLNRLSRDIGFVDETLPAVAIEITVIFVNVFGILTVILIIDYTNLLTALLLLAVAIILRVLAGSTITKLKQMEGVTRSPVYSHISTTLSGLSTIRASQVQDRFMVYFDQYQDTHSGVYFSYILTSRWLTIAMDWLCSVFIALVITVLMSFSLNSTNASLVGLLISQVVVLPGPFQWGIRQLIELESQMTSVQRIKEFSELEPEEATETRKPKDKSAAIVDEKKPTKIVKEGEIVFDQISLAYFPDEPPVLKCLNFTVNPGEKVGIVGRTGAGKSSIVSVLFRLYNFEGSVRIDGTDTKDVPLAQLRRVISIIPQDPVLFGGTIRKNLDPFEEYRDDELWEALEAVRLKQLFSRHSSKLEFIIQEGGSNFSVGQRQLICLARAIVRRNKVLVLDEATANVDPETDEFIQKTIRNQFSDCTVITIAHRLITIAGVDKVLVMSQGEVKEFASPKELLDDEKSLFSEMVAGSSGQAESIKRAIRTEHEKRLKA